MAVASASPRTPPGEPPSNVQTSGNLVHFDPKLAVPSQPIYLQRNDYLVFYTYSTVASAQIRVNYRYLTPEGEIKEGQFLSVPFTNVLITGFSIYEGWLLSFQVTQITAQGLGAWTFTQVSIGRSATLTLGVQGLGCLWSGFVLNNASNGWPGVPSKEISDGPGTIRSITGTLPAAGAEILETVPPNRRWQLLAFKAPFTTSAAVANRIPGFLIDDGASILYQTHVNTPQAASSLSNYQLAAGGNFYNDSDGFITLPFPPPIPVKWTWRIRSQTTALQAADQWSAPQYLVLEWGMWDA